MKKPISDKKKVELIRFWSKWFYVNTETFSGALGRQLAYLWPAIINDNQIEVSERSAIVQILKHRVAPDSDIWGYLDIVG
jgi:hypothetical protein